MITETGVGPQLTRVYAEAYAWIHDCFEDAPADLTFAEVKAGVNRHYDGGWDGFIVDCRDILFPSCIHPGVFAQGPVPGAEYCPSCNCDVPRTEL